MTKPKRCEVLGHANMLSSHRTRFNNIHLNFNIFSEFKVTSQTKKTKIVLFLLEYNSTKLDSNYQDYSLYDHFDFHYYKTVFSQKYCYKVKLFDPFRCMVLPQM